MKLIFLRNSDTTSNAEERNKKLQDYYADVRDVGVKSDVYYLFFILKKKRSLKTKKQLHVTEIDDISWHLLQLMMTQLFQKYWEWQQENDESRHREEIHDTLDQHKHTKYIRQGSVEVPRLLLKKTVRILGKICAKWIIKKMDLRSDRHQKGCHQIYSFMWTDYSWISSSSKVHLELRLTDLIEETERKDLESKLTSFW